MNNTLHYGYKGRRAAICLMFRFETLASAVWVSHSCRLKSRDDLLLFLHLLIVFFLTCVMMDIRDKLYRIKNMKKPVVRVRLSVVMKIAKNGFDFLPPAVQVLQHLLVFVIMLIIWISYWQRNCGAAIQRFCPTEPTCICMFCLWDPYASLMLAEWEMPWWERSYISLQDGCSHCLIARAVVKPYK